LDEEVNKFMLLGKENLKSKVVEGHKVFFFGEYMLPRHFQGQPSPKKLYIYNK
jgi:hypothetical protein